MIFKLKKKQFAFGGLILAALIFSSLFFYGIFIEPYQIEIRHLWIEDSQLGKILEDKIAVHISDLHMSKIGRREQKVLNILDELNPDFVFLTGDYIKWNGNYEMALEFLSKLKARIGVWAVLGDYDYSRSRKSCLFCHEPGSGKPTRQHSVRFLRNSIERVKLPEGYVQIGAIDEEGERPFFSKAKLLPWGKYLEGQRVVMWTPSER